ncbi:MAG TPA: MmgE/PrpD family protein [Stellaceae bacterium]|jgi:2-methylcitrate dehydratase PrpD|nr:MmgE/PrpD family protein [Stellaceae bacterium]
MPNETVRLAEYATGLRYEDLPSEVVTAAKDCIIDTVAACICGSSLPWSRIVIDYAERTGPGGNSRILGRGSAVQAPSAALANGALAHAFELDSLTRPGAGAHPGATVLPPALAVAQQADVKATGRDLIAAFVAGNEVMIRIGRATGHTNEARGFHAPGTTGPFGAAVACGHLLGLDAAGMTNAIGIAGSLAGGLLEFAKGDGGTVKRLHLGRASEAGVLAASLAQAGFAGPRTVIEGQFGFLRVFCTEWDESHLTRGLGSDYVMRSAVLKRYPVHATAHAAVRAVRDLQAKHRFTGNDVATITVTGTARMVERHNILEPPDLMLAQYSIPFCVALALHREARDPESYDESALADPQIRALTRRVKLVPDAGGGHGHGSTGSTVTVTLTDGRVLEHHVESGLLEAGELADKFTRLTRAALGERGAALYERLQNLERESRLDWLGTTD